MYSMVPRRWKRRMNPGCLLVISLLVIRFLLLVSMTNHISQSEFQTLFANKKDVSRFTADNARLGKYQYDDTRSQIFCTYTSNKEVEQFFGEIKSDMGDWTYKDRVKCNTLDIGNQFAFIPRRKLSIQCSNGVATVTYSWTFNSSDVLTFDRGDLCLNMFVNACCVNDRKIPNVVHYVSYMRGNLTFIPFLSILSVIRFVKPCAIIIHGELPSTGIYWDAITYFYPNIIHLKRKRPTHIFGIKIGFKTHSSDIMRLEALSKYGGIYMDTDTILVRPLENLMDYPFILSNQSNGVIGSAFIMSEKNASFLQLWLNEYKTDYRPKHYIYNAMLSTKKLAENDKNKDLIHVEYGTISRPEGLIRDSIYNNTYATYDWSKIYGMHMFIRIHKQLENEITIRNSNNTFASVCRHVFYGNKELCL